MAMKFLKGFLIIISLYFVLHTIIVFGLLDGQYKEIISGLKELVWIGFIAVIAACHWQRTREYVRTTKYMVRALLALALIGVAVTRRHYGNTLITLKDSIIGLKYGWYFMVIFWTAGLVGYVVQADDQQTKSWVVFIVRLSRFVLLIGLIVQGSKVLFPELWYRLGFGPLNIYQAGVAPPLYYLTQQGGVMRYSGLFSGPNNFAFWLIGMMPLLWAESGKLKAEGGRHGRWMDIVKKIGLLAFAGLNLGRALLVGLLSQLMIAAAKQSWVKKHLFAVGLGIGLIIGLFGYITYLKWDSTTEHFALGLDALYKFFANPWGYGLGSSGPGVHRHGSLLPENYYLQLALDYGFWGPIGFAGFWLAVLTLIKQQSVDVLHRYNMLFVMGFVGMLIAGLFLHVFEDSMVNYLFFVARGIVFGRSLQKKI
ncbi:MAG: hypothetical protein WC004_00825 [Candidatus Absconditabacterales bacterium]